MSLKLLSLKSCFFTAALICVFQPGPKGLCESPQKNSAGLSQVNSQEAPTEELWSLVRSLRQLREDHYEKQRERTDQIRQIRETTYNLQAQADELEQKENQLDKDLAQIKTDIRKLQAENKNDIDQKLSLTKALEDFTATQTWRVEKGIPYRKDDRLTRLKAIQPSAQPQQDRSIADLLGGIWSFSQEEMRLARSGETYTDLISLTDSRRQYARLFRAGHLVLGYVTEADEQTGMWIENFGWRKSDNSEAQAIRSAVKILDQREVPDYVQLPVNMDPREIDDKDGEN